MMGPIFTTQPYVLIEFKDLQGDNMSLTLSYGNGVQDVPKTDLQIILHEIADSITEQQS